MSKNSVGGVANGECVFFAKRRGPLAHRPSRARYDWSRACAAWSVGAAAVLTGRVRRPRGLTHRGLLFHTPSSIIRGTVIPIW